MVNPKLPLQMEIIKKVKNDISKWAQWRWLHKITKTNDILDWKMFFLSLKIHIENIKLDAEKYQWYILIKFKIIVAN